MTQEFIRIWKLFNGLHNVFFLFRHQRLPWSVPEWSNMQGMDVFILMPSPIALCAAAHTWTKIADVLGDAPRMYCLVFVIARGLFISLCVFFRRVRGVTTASVVQVSWALTVKSRGISVTADHARTAASVTQCWTALCVSARQSLLDSCVRWVSCSTGHSAGLLWMHCL